MNYIVQNKIIKYFYPKRSNKETPMLPAIKFAPNFKI